MQVELRAAPKPAVPHALSCALCHTTAQISPRFPPWCPASNQSQTFGASRLQLGARLGHLSPYQVPKIPNPCVQPWVAACVAPGTAGRHRGAQKPAQHKARVLPATSHCGSAAVTALTKGALETRDVCLVLSDLGWAAAVTQAAPRPSPPAGFPASPSLGSRQ